MDSPTTDTAAGTVGALGERALVDRITRRLPRPGWVVIGVGDDAAAVEPVPRALEVLTTDTLVEGVHFDLRFVPPDALGHRALAVSLSDIAAMGGRPRAALLSLVVPSALDVAVIDGLLDGLLALANTHQVAIVGGNVTRSPGPLMVDVTVTGSVHRRRVLTRQGARVGDHVYVTGHVGDAALGLQRLQARHAGTPGTEVPPAPTLPGAEARYLRPEPRLRAGLMLGQHKAATACIDLSDGLGDGLWRLADGSGLGIEVDATTLPLSQELRGWCGENTGQIEQLVFQGGDDYELLFTVSPRAKGRLRTVQRLTGDLPITRIGVVTKGRGVTLRTLRGSQPVPQGFAHFG